MSRKFAIPYWAYGLLVLTFGYMLYNVWYSSHNIGHLNAEHIKPIDYIGGISEDLTDSHLWLEKYLTPPNDPNHLKAYQAIWKTTKDKIEELRQLVRVHSLENHENKKDILHDIQSLDEQLLAVDALARRRIADLQKGGINSPLDDEYEQRLDSALNTAATIEQAIIKSTDREVAAFQRNRKILFVTAVMAMIVALVLLWILDRSRRKNAESTLAAKQELLRSAGFLQAFYHATPDMIFLHGENGQIVDASDNAVKRYGCPKEELVQWELGRLMGKDCDVEVGRRNLMRAMSGEAVDFEWVARAADGEEFPVNIRLRALPEVEGERARVVAYIQDISARKQTEAEIEHRSRINIGINRLLSIAMLDLPLAKRLEQALACILDQAWLGLSPKGAIFMRRGDVLEMQAGINIGELTQLCANVPAGECLCGKVLKTGEPVLTAHVDDDHSIRSHDMKDHGHVIVPLNRQDELLGVLNLYIDAGQSLRGPEQEFVDTSARILAQMIARDRLMNQMQRLKVVVEQIPEGIFIANTGGRIVYANPSAAAMAGMPDHQLVGRFAAEVRGGKKDDAIYRDISSRLNQGKPWHGDIKYVHSNGDSLVIERSVAPVMEDGEVRYHVSVDTDVTEIRQQQSKLDHTQRLESLGVLAGGIAHDFNNILAAIMGNAALGRMKMKDTDPSLTYMTRIEESSQRAAELCKQMLAYSGKGRFVVKAINLSDMVEEITKLLEVSIAKNVVLKFHLASNLPNVEADAAQLQQVIMNLVINASDAIGSRSGVISLSTGMMQADQAYLDGAYASEDIEPGRFVFLEVADTGCGMDDETKKKLFDPFFTTKFTGRGLGMSAVLGIVRGHHGAIKVYSEEGQGTTFKMLLPASESAAAGKMENEAWGDWCGVGTVLVVDDEETVRETAAMMLRDMGFDTLTAEDGEQGIEIYRKHQDDIIAVLLDMTMPKLDGKGCFRELRRINKDVRVVLSSGYNEQDATNRFAGQGLAGFIQKPYPPEALRARMKEVLDRDVS